MNSMNLGLSRKHGKSCWIIWFGNKRLLDWTPIHFYASDTMVNGKNDVKWGRMFSKCSLVGSSFYKIL